MAIELFNKKPWNFRQLTQKRTIITVVDTFDVFEVNGQLIYFN